MKIPMNNKILDKMKLPYEESAYYYKLILIILIAFKTLFYFFNNYFYGIKYAAFAVIAYFLARECEVLYHSHFKKLTREEGKQITKETKPEITALLIVLLVTPTIPFIGVIFAVFFSVFIVKLAFGGFSYNIFNPALVGVSFIIANWNSKLSVSKIEQFSKLDYLPLKDNINVNFFSQIPITYLAFNLIVIITFIFLIYKKVINYKLPITTLILLFIATVSIVISYTIKINISQDTNVQFGYIFINILSFYPQLLIGTTLLAILICTADPITMPQNNIGIIYSSLIIATITIYTYLFTNNIYGAIYGVLFANMLTPLFNIKFKDKDISVKKQLATTVIITIIVSVLFAMSCEVGGVYAN